MIVNKEQEETNNTASPRASRAVPQYKPCKKKHKKCWHCDDLWIRSLPFYICCTCFDLHPRHP